MTKKFITVLLVFVVVLSGCTGRDDAYERGYADGYAAAQSETKYSVGSSRSSSTTVYVTKTGTKYHRDGCSYLKSKRAISLQDAKAQGYDPCSRCNPPE